MRKQVLRIVVTLGLFGLLCAGAQAQTSANRMRVHVPFDFIIGQQTLPAGDYLISFVTRETNSTALLIKRSDGSASRIVQMTPVEARKARESATLVFNRYGSRHFLSQFWTPAERVGLAVRKSRAERTVEVAGDAQRSAVELAAGK